MSFTERFYMTMPEEIPTWTEGVRVAPNEGSFPVDATVKVVDEDDRILTFKMFPKGSDQKDYLISLIESDPPLSAKPLAEKDIYVRGDKLVKGDEFTLDSAFPILSQTAFKAMRIFSNVEKVEIPTLD